MKRSIYAIALITLSATILFSSCAQNKGNSDAKAAAKVFVEQLYTVTTSDVETFNSLNSAKPDNDDTDSIKKAEENAKNLTDKLNSKFKTLVTDDEITSLIKNTTYTQIVKPASTLKCQLKPKDVVIDNEEVNDNTYKYNYTIKIIIDTAGAGEKQIATESGIVQVEKTGGKWLANYVTRIKTSELLTK